MEWKALLYTPSEVEEEKELRNWIRHPEKGILCQKVAAEVSREELLATVAAVGVTVEDCLWIVTREEQWRLARELGLAALPYIGEKSPGIVATPDFSGAWMVVEGFEEADYDFFQKVYQRAHGLPWTVITTERCFLREFSMEDMNALFTLYEGEGITDHMEGLYPRKQEEDYQRAYIENMYRYYGYGMWLVCSRDTGQVIGRAGLEHRDYPQGTELEMGYLIAADCQNQGYGTEVCWALLEYAKEFLDFPRVNCLIEKDNAVSIHMMEKLGFTLLEETIMDGKPMNRYIKYCFLEGNKI
jgi:RimJ/RimL family protein N-acetyltransferase